MTGRKPIHDAPRQLKDAWRSPIVGAALIILLTVLAYLPVMHGGFLWDDGDWTTGIVPLLRDLSGLRLMWCQPTALQQYYPLSGTTFWLDYHLWGFWTLPYHVENVLLHAVSAVLFWQLLRRLETPGAWLAGAVFALHPVMVKSAGWITERKNVLSLVFYLGALLAYGRFNSFWKEDNGSRAQHRGAYGLALLLCLCALLAKTTAFSLPATIVLIGWWKRGRVRWREDVLPTLPMFALAIGLCWTTAWLEKTHIGAQGPDFALTFPEHSVIAGRVPWFYIGKLLWQARSLLCVSAVAARAPGHGNNGCIRLPPSACLSRSGWRGDGLDAAGGGGILLRGHTFPAVGILQRIWDAVFVRVGSLGIPPQPRPYRAGRGTGSPCGCCSPRAPGVPRSGGRRADGLGNTHSEAGAHLSKPGNALERHPDEESPVLAGA